MNAKRTKASNSQIARFLGEMYAHNNSMKLYHWLVTGSGSYDRHIAIDQALETMREALDRLVETSIALYGDMDIVLAETQAPGEVFVHCQKFYDHIQKSRDLFPEGFSNAILDDYSEALQQVLYRMVRLQ